MEGCDIVDFVYVLYMCSKQTDFKKKEVNEVLKIFLDDLLHLYNYEDNAFFLLQREVSNSLLWRRIYNGLIPRYIMVQLCVYGR